MLDKDKKIEDNISIDVRNLFRHKKEVYDNTVKDIRTFFRLNKENEAIKDNNYGY